VVSKALPGVTLFDAATDRQICQVKMDVAPHEAAFTRDGQLLIVPIYSSANIGQPGPDGHAINFMRTSDCAIEHVLDTGAIKRPHFAETGASGLVYVTAEQDQAILIVDPVQRAIVGQLPTGSRNTHFFALTHDEQRIFTSNVGDRTLSVIDVPGRRLLATVEIDGAPFVSRFSPDGRYLYNMGMEPDAQLAGIRVWKIDLATRRVVAQSSAKLGVGTGGIQVNPVNGLLYLTAYSGQVSVLDPGTLRLVRQFAAADTPDGIFFSGSR